MMRSPDDGTGGGNGDGGTGDGGTPPAAPVVDEKKLANIVNSVVTSHLKRNLGSTVADAVKAAFDAQSAATPAAPAAPPAGGDAADDPKEQELAKMRSDVANMRKEMEATKATAKAEQDKAIVAAERSALSDALRKGGVDDTRLGAAGALLYLDQKLVKRNDEDQICMEFQREWGPELVPIEKGVTEYLTTDAGKIFLPPVDASGSGNTGGRPPARKPGEKLSKSEMTLHLGKLMMNRGG